MKKTIRCLVLGCGILFVVSCQPFLLSMFPGYLADSVAVADANGLIAGGNVDHFDFCALNNGSVEYVFLLANYYDGTKTLYIFDNNLAYLTHFTDPGFGSRRMIDNSGRFVIGSRVLDPGTFAMRQMYNYPTPNGYGCVLLNLALGPSNFLLDQGSNFVYFTQFTSDWLGFTSSGNVSINQAGGYNYRMVGAGRLLNTTLGTDKYNLSVLAFREESGWPERGYAVVLQEDITTSATYGDFSALSSLLIPSSHHLVIPLGGINSGDYEVFGTADGVVARGADNTLRLFGWDGQEKAATRDNGASGRVLIDFSPVDYYYIFDPASLKIVKARDWWQTN